LFRIEILSSLLILPPSNEIGPKTNSQKNLNADGCADNGVNSGASVVTPELLNHLKSKQLERTVDLMGFLV
jgi:hypothetical protein